MSVGDSDRSAYRTLLACCVGHASCHLTMLMFPTLMLSMRDSLGMGAAEIGLAYWVCCFLFGVGAPAAGWFTDRVGARASLTVFLIGVAAGLALLGLWDGRTGLWAGMAVLGLANSIYHPAGMTAISLTEHARRGRSLGVVGIAGSIGVAAGPFAAGVLGKALGWEGAYVAVAGLMVVMAIVIWALVPGRSEMRAIDKVGMKQHADKLGAKGGLAALVLLLFAMACQGLVYRLMMTSTPLYLRSLRWPEWFDLGWLGMATAFVMLIGAFGQVIGGWWSDSASAKHVYPRVVSVSILALAALFFLPGFVGLAALSVFMVAHFSGQPVENVLVAQRTASARRSLGYGMKFVLAFGGGSIIVPLVPILYDQDRLLWLFLIGAVVSTLGVGCIFASAWLDRRKVGNSAEGVS